MKNSHNHHMYSEVDHWFYRHIAGIKINEQGIVIEPNFLSSLDWAKATHRDISVSWDKETLNVTVPKNATVIINGKPQEIGAGTHTFRR